MFGNSSTANTGFSFGKSDSTVNSGFSFGGFGGATSSIGQKTSTSGFNFGSINPNSSAGSSPFSLGASQAAGTGFSFGNAITKTSSSGFGGGLKLPGQQKLSNFGTSLGSNMTTASPGLGGGFGNLNTTASFQGGNNIFTANVSTNQMGLGGMDSRLPLNNTSLNGNTIGLANVVRTGEIKSVKENTVIPEINASIEEFLKHVKSQKSIRENIARMSPKNLLKVEEDIKELQLKLNQVTSSLQSNSVAIVNLKKESTQELKNAEIAQRTKETPPVLQYENVAPAEYFQRLADNFTNQLLSYQQQFQEMENFLLSVNQFSAPTPQELSSVFKKLNEGFIALAARLQIVNEAVQIQKEAYLSYRRKNFSDNTDIFSKGKNPSETTLNKLASSFYVMPKTTLGPTPFSNITNSSLLSSNNSSSQQNSQNITNTLQGQTMGFNLFNKTNTPAYNNDGGSRSNFGGFANTSTNLFSPQLSQQQSNGLTTLNNCFTTPNTLQKTSGNKRGKNA